MSSWTFSQPLTTSEPLMIDLLAGRGLIDDAFRVGLAAARRIDPFAVDAFMHGDDIARLGQRAAAEMVLSILDVEPSLASLPLTDTWYSVRANAVDTIARVKQCGERFHGWDSFVRGGFRVIGIFK